MNPPMIRLRSLVASSFAAGLALLAAPAVQATMTVVPSKLGNVFYNTETVTIPVQVSQGTLVSYQVFNYWGTQTYSGNVTVGGGVANITPNLYGKVGYFSVSLSEKSGSTVVSTNTTQFVVLQPIDITTMGSSPFGVDCLFAQNTPTSLDALLQRAGLSQIRDEQYWESVEGTKGVYNFPSQFTGYMSAAASDDIIPLITLDWGNKNYDYLNNDIYTVPYTTSGLAGYANYAKAVLAEYPGQISNFEIWNEIDGGTFDYIAPGYAKDKVYTSLVEAVYNAIKPANPSVNVVVGGVVPVDVGFLQMLFQDGVMPYTDKVSCHPYLGVPENAALQLTGLDGLVKSFNSGTSKPIIATEWGLDTTDPLAEAAYIPRFITEMLSVGAVEKMFYFPLMDATDWPDRGLIMGTSSSGRGDYLGTPSFATYGTAIRQLYGTTYGGQAAGLSSTSHAFYFHSGSNITWVLWGTAPSTLTITSPTGNTFLTDCLGNQVREAVTNGACTIPISTNVQYLTIDSTTLSTVTEAANKVVADSEQGYSNVQGTYGWYYGYGKNISGTAYNYTTNFANMTWGIWNNNVYRWIDGTYPYQDVDQMMPGGGTSWAIRRWNSGSVSGTATITGSAQIGSASSNGTNLRIYVNGYQVYSTALVGGAAATSINVTGVSIPANADVDFALDCNGSDSYDATSFAAQITMN